MKTTKLEDLFSQFQTEREADQLPLREKTLPWVVAFTVKAFSGEMTVKELADKLDTDEKHVRSVLPTLNRKGYLIYPKPVEKGKEVKGPYNKAGKLVYALHNLDHFRGFVMSRLQMGYSYNKSAFTAIATGLHKYPELRESFVTMIDEVNSNISLEKRKIKSFQPVTAK